VPSRRVAACVVTGFLGSGKTTLLRGLLEAAPSRERIAVVVNEVGEIGIDGRVIEGFEFVENVVELASGCVCCSIDEYRFDMAIEELVRRIDPALVVIETSGVADPAPALERLRRCGLGVDAVVTVVDALAWRRAWRTSSAARRQIEAADFLVISKKDLVDERTLGRLRTKLASQNPRALVLESERGKPFAGAELLFATTAASRQPEAGSRPPAGSNHLRDDGIDSFSWSSGRHFEREPFEQALRGLPAEVLRAKGFLARTDGRGAWLFQLVCGRVEITAFEGRALPSNAVSAQGVFIGTSVAALRDRIITALESAAT
jgi:cobalamin biosynthesis protein CobW